MLESFTLFPEPGALVAGANPFTVVCVSTDAADGTWVQASGELDLAGAPELSSALRGAARASGLVALDLSELGFIDCSGVHAIVDCSVQQRSEGRRLLLAGCSERVRRIFALTGTGTEVEFVELCEAEALIGTLPTSQSVAA